MPSKKWNLKVISGPALGKKFTLEGDVAILGRKKADVTIGEDKEISSTHAEIHIDPKGDGLVIVDLKSRNGTEVNGRNVQRAALKHGDRFRIGKTEFLIEDTEVSSAIIQKSLSVNTASVITSVKGESTQSVAASEVSDVEAFDRFYFLAFKDVIERPRAFFESFAKEEGVARAIVFGAVNILLALMLQNFLAPIFGLKPFAEGLFGGELEIVPAVAVLYALSLMGAAVGTLLYHAISVALGEKAPLRKAIQIYCYATAGNAITGIILLVPYIGVYLAVFGIGYSFYLLAIGATVAYKVDWRKAQVACAIAAVFFATVHIGSYVFVGTSNYEARVPASQNQSMPPAMPGSSH